MIAQEGMRRALEEARRAFLAGEIPVGAAVFQGDALLFAAHNQCERQNDPTAHAELLAIRGAAKRLGDWRLSGCTLYVTLEPCAMCAGAIANSRLSRVVFGAWDRQAGALGGRLDVPAALDASCAVTGGLLGEACEALLRQFFAARRA